MIGGSMCEGEEKVVFDEMGSGLDCTPKVRHGGK
jgi:hypothetical protein